MEGTAVWLEVQDGFSPKQLKRYFPSKVLDVFGKQVPETGSG